jgi:outer membrane protein OmpA-like peptidoglycan-associated protein
MSRLIRITFVSVAALLFSFTTRVVARAQDGQLKLHATPRDAYIFVDRHPVGVANKHHTLKLSAGNHKVELMNYGYVPASRDITITAGQPTELEMTLDPITSSVSVPFGAITIEGASESAVLLNGRTPDFFVGHGDEFNHDWWWKQELVVPPDNYEVTVLRPDGETWSVTANVPANQRVVIHVPDGIKKTVDWPRGRTFISIPRFSVGTASATVAVAKPIANLSATAAQVDCGGSSDLRWTSSDAPQVKIEPVGEVATAGQQTVQPKHTTSYQLSAVGPGGRATAATTVTVNSAVQATLTLSPAEVHYERVADHAVQESHTALNWTSTNASTVSIDQLGTVGVMGSQTVPIKPLRTSPGPVDETVTYTLSATNECGGTATQTATLHIVGSIEAPPELAMRSVYFQTDVPAVGDTQNGLLASEQETLKSIAEAFKKYVAVSPGARLTLSGHADKRGPSQYNHSLSERRVQLVKKFLSDQGISAEAIETQALGSDQNLSVNDVEQILQQDPNLSDDGRQVELRRLDTMVLANNRRVDVTLSPLGQESLREYPYRSDDFLKLIDRNPPTSRPGMEFASQKEKIPNE